MSGSDSLVLISDIKENLNLYKKKVNYIDDVKLNYEIFNNLNKILCEKGNNSLYLDVIHSILFQIEKTLKVNEFTKEYQKINKLLKNINSKIIYENHRKNYKSHINSNDKNNYISRLPNKIIFKVLENINMCNIINFIDTNEKNRKIGIDYILKDNLLFIEDTFPDTKIGIINKSVLNKKRNKRYNIMNILEKNLFLIESEHLKNILLSLLKSNLKDNIFIIIKSIKSETYKSNINKLFSSNINLIINNKLSYLDNVWGYEVNPYDNMVDNDLDSLDVFDDMDISINYGNNKIYNNNYKKGCKYESNLKDMHNNPKVKNIYYVYNSMYKIIKNNFVNYNKFKPIYQINDFNIEIENSSEKIFNPQTRRFIKKGGVTYKKLIKQGIHLT